MNLSIITIYQEGNEYLDGYLQVLPGECEVILCKTIPWQFESKFTRLGSEIINNSNIIHCEYRYRCSNVNDYLSNTFNFSEIQNAVKSLATRKYIMKLDSDERVLIEKKESELFEQDNIGGMKVFVHSNQNSEDGKISFAGGVTRIFLNHSDINFEGRAHEDVMQSILKLGLPVFDTTILIKHLGYSVSQTEILRKHLRNIGLMSSDVQKLGSPNEMNLVRFVLGKTFESLELLKKFKIFQVNTPELMNLKSLTLDMKSMGISVDYEPSQLENNIRLMAAGIMQDVSNGRLLMEQYLNLWFYKQIGGF